jgi:hypothetical protein
MQHARQQDYQSGKHMPGKLGMRTVLVAASMIVLMLESEASGLDLHWLWENRCVDCHGHAGDFSRKFLNVSDGELQGPHHVHDLRRFLSNHYLAGNEVDAVYNMLLAMATTQARFKDECSSCHDSAANLVRAELALREGVLVSRSSGQPVGEFLASHQDLEPDDADFFLGVLNRVAHEVYQP